MVWTSDLQTVMFADSKEEHAFSVIDPAVPADIKSGPRRLLIIILGLLVGGSLGMFFSFFSIARNLNRRMY